MEEILRTGTSGVELAYGAPLYTYAGRDPRTNRALAERCESFFAACDLKHEAADHIAQRSHRVIADLGGGHGLLICEVLARAPACQGILFDLPETLALHRPRLEGVPRLTLVEGDFLQSVPPADAYISANVLFNWTDERALSLLHHVRSAMTAGGMLYVLDFFHNGSFEGAFLNLDELVTTGGVCRTRDAATELLLWSGFSATQVLGGEGPSTAFLYSVIRTYGNQSASHA